MSDCDCTWDTGQSIDTILPSPLVLRTDRNTLLFANHTNHRCQSFCRGPCHARCSLVKSAGSRVSSKIPQTARRWRLRLALLLHPLGNVHRATVLVTIRLDLAVERRLEGRMQQYSSSSSSRRSRTDEHPEHPHPHHPLDHLNHLAVDHHDHYRDSVRYSSSVYTSSGTASARSASPATAQAQAQQQLGLALGGSTPTARKKTSLAAINAPSFSAFRSQVPSAVRRPANVHEAAFQQQKSPRAASFSISEKASPRLADPHWRPYSVDSPLPTPGLHATHHRQGSEVVPLQLYAEQVGQPREEVDR